MYNRKNFLILLLLFSNLIYSHNPKNSENEVILGDLINILPLKIKLIIKNLNQNNKLFFQLRKNEIPQMVEFLKNEKMLDDFTESIYLKLGNNNDEYKILNDEQVDILHSCLRKKLICYEGFLEDLRANSIRSFSNDKKLSNGLILYGPPGNGKSTIAKKIAELTDSNLFELKGSTIIGPYENEGSKTIEKTFESAIYYFNKNLKRAIIFIDEIDAIATTKMNNRPNVSLLSATQTLWLNMDRVKNNNGIFIIFATNDFESLHHAVKDRIRTSIEIKNPDFKDRKNIMNFLFKKYQISFDKKIDLDRFVKLTDGLSIRSIENIILESLMNAESNGLVKVSTFEHEINQAKKKFLVNKFNDLLEKFFDFGRILTILHTILMISRDIRYSFFNNLNVGYE